MSCVRLLLLAAAGAVIVSCSLSIPEPITPDQLPMVNDQQVAVAMQSCVKRLNAEAKNARTQRTNADVLAIVGAAISASSGTASAILAADSATSGDRGQKISAAITAGISAISAVVAVAAKIAESPAVPLSRRTKAESGYVNARKALAMAVDPKTHKLTPAARELAIDYFVECAVAMDSQDFKNSNVKPAPPPDAEIIDIRDGGADDGGGVGANTGAHH